MDALTSFLGGGNVSYFTVPAAFVLLMTPKYYAAAISKGLYDPANPRKFQKTINETDKLDKIVKDRIFRAEACHNNALESVGLYAAAVVAGNTAGIPMSTMNNLSVGYVASRTAYMVVYVWLQDNRRFAPLRGLFWGVGIALIWTMFIKAGLRV